MLKYRVRLSCKDASCHRLTTLPRKNFARLIGTPKCPALIDVRTEDDFGAGPRLIPGALRRSHENAHEWVAEFRGRAAVVVCQKGLKLSQGVAALLREAVFQAEVLEDGFAGWARSKLHAGRPIAKLPPRNAQGGPSG